MTLATRLDVETIFQRSFTTDVEQSAIDQLLLSAEQAVNNYLKMPIESAAVVAETHHFLHTSHRLILKVRPVTVVTQIREDSVILVENTDYVVVNLQAGLVHRILGLTSQTSWQRGYNTVEVDYTAGFASVPEDITQVVAEAAYGSWLGNQADGSGSDVAGPVVSKRIDEYTVRYADSSVASAEFAAAGILTIGSLTPNHQAMLSAYKNRRMI